MIHVDYTACVCVCVCSFKDARTYTAVFLRALFLIGYIDIFSSRAACVCEVFWSLTEVRRLYIIA